MKMWQKILSVTLVLSLTAALIGCVAQEQKDCCLCNTFRYHAPCLIDLETGEMIELDLYFPHETKVAELAEEQPEMSTFSLIHLGNVSGYKLTDTKIVEIEVPTADTTNNPALCENCRKLLQNGYNGRYVLADLYDMENRTLISIVDGEEVNLRCYEITMSQNEENNGIKVVVHGILEQID